MKGNLVFSPSVHSLFHRLGRRLRHGLMRTAGLAALVAMPTCSQSIDDPRGSETHFLKGCSQSCGNGLECIDGQCTVLCTTDTVCSNLNAKASCEAQPSGLNACEVGCKKDSDCTSVLPELSCEDGVCRGPLWQVNPVVDSGGADAACEGEAICPDKEALYFMLHEQGTGTVRIEFLFDLGEVPFTRCTAVFEDNEMVESSCESDAVAPAVFEACGAPTSCEAGQLRFDVRPNDFVVNYWEEAGYQTVPLDTTQWSNEPYTVGTGACETTCTTPYMAHNLPSSGRFNACLNPEECRFGLGCGNRQSALANAPACDVETSAVRAGEACGYDVLVYQQYIESSRAFYDRNSGELVGYWHVSDTQQVDCSGRVPPDCRDGIEGLVDICEQ